MEELNNEKREILDETFMLLQELVKTSPSYIKEYIENLITLLKKEESPKNIQLLLYTGLAQLQKYMHATLENFKVFKSTFENLSSQVAVLYLDDALRVIDEQFEIVKHQKKFQNTSQELQNVAFARPKPSASIHKLLIMRSSARDSVYRQGLHRLYIKEVLNYKYIWFCYFLDFTDEIPDISGYSFS